MEIKGKVHCLFEQSGTFKNEFRKLGYEAYDYDIQNNFGETDYVVDLFGEIDKAYHVREGGTMFDEMTADDLIIAFFPCIHFCNMAEYNQRSAQESWRRHGMPVDRIYELLEKKADDRHYFYKMCLWLFGAVEKRGLRLIMENPWDVQNYTNFFFFAKPKVIDNNRTVRGDWFVKPTAYWFMNCEPTHGFSHQQTDASKIKRVGMADEWRRKKNNRDTSGIEFAKGSGKAGLCSEERSMISPDYARNWICDFVLGKEQDIEPHLDFGGTA